MSRPIGVFDSGIGGLTVVRELQKLMPRENIVYFGDTARLPYGSKSDTLIRRYSLENALFLNSKLAKIIVIACNTASASSATFLQGILKLPVVGVVESGASVAARTTKNKRVGVIGTKSTVRSQAYSTCISRIDPTIRTFEVATPLLVHLVEENWVDRDITREILRDYLSPLIAKGVDALILGCTHYPLLKNAIHSVTDGITLIDSSKEIAYHVSNMMSEYGLLTNTEAPGTTSVYLSDETNDFANWSMKVLGRGITPDIVDHDRHVFSG
jgi:glutamate racemase